MGICHKHHSGIVEGGFVFSAPLFYSLALTKEPRLLLYLELCDEHSLLCGARCMSWLISAGFRGRWLSRWQGGIFGNPTWLCTRVAVGDQASKTVSVGGIALKGASPRSGSVPTDLSPFPPPPPRFQLHSCKHILRLLLTLLLFASPLSHSHTHTYTCPCRCFPSTSDPSSCGPLFPLWYLFLSQSLA